MRGQDVCDLYDREYAERYDERFLLGPQYLQSTEHELSILRDLLQDGKSWLDVGCGTGYFLSRFPGTKRAGLDLAPAMLELAERANPGAELVLGDFLLDRPEWDGRWDLVSCMWQAYSYVDTLDEVFRLVRNLAVWTAPRGSCFLPLCDLEVICGHQIPFHRALDTADGALQIGALVWTCLEPSGRKHVNLIAPHRALLVAGFEKYFDKVTVVDYPLGNPDASGSRPCALLAQGRSIQVLSPSQNSQG